MNRGLLVGRAVCQHRARSEVVGRALAQHRAHDALPVKHMVALRATYSTTPTPTPTGRFVLPEKYANMIRNLLQPFVPRYQGPAIGLAIYTSCTTYPDFDAFWLAQCNMPHTFQTWFSTTSFYVWMAMVRLRASPHAKHYMQGLIDAFFRDAEAKMRASGVTSGRIVNDTLKDLVSSFKGTVMSLDEGFATSDAVLAAAVWRNLVPEDDAVLQVDAVVRFVREQLSMLDACKMEDVLAGGFKFGPVMGVAGDKAGDKETKLSG
ncbi:Ubiquinol cytochrome-c reductase assembly protein Cbp3 [Coemansia sp. RSA 1807]|nr:Ubiquinol cytochrome-c reductase assembly protein Cbp3 [Coemansia sp. RSA 921]KAJ2144590.1 Ubiquinol cytochrome-c reductase assembly protein Cbp3 [Coemansia sp. RSA 564]KAJ2172806.1 Ubiquinol cytochrome-c reductase assembly protein Cbp3 [Coemansia sp. RSA 560]KAJ2576448.1 Ubiquinol cytochrome-c reductase assembly protein Cbp3 [Coemansia sp. RSA 1807]